MLAAMPYVPPPDATPEGVRMVNQLRVTMFAPVTKSDRPSIQAMVKCMVKEEGFDPEGLRYDRSKPGSRLHNKEYLVYLILQSKGHGSAAMAEWRTPRSKGRSATKRTASEAEAEACQPADHEDDEPELFDITAFARCALGLCTGCKACPAHQKWTFSLLQFACKTEAGPCS